MPNLSFGDKSYTVNHAVKGPDYIHGYNADGTLLIAFDGVSDFSGFSYNGTYMDPTECATEGCNGTILVGGELKTKDGRNVTAAQVGARPNTWMPTAAQVGALPTTGGTMTGPLTVPEATVNAKDAYPKMYMRGTGGNSLMFFMRTETGEIVLRNADDDTGFYENFQFPCDATLSANNSYKVVTTKTAKVLWTNASPTSSFAEQSVSIDAIKNSDCIVIVLNHSTGTNFFHIAHRSASVTRSTTPTYTENTTGTSYTSYRGLGIDWTNGKINFGDGYVNGTVNNGRAVPVAVVSLY